jgi:dUTP pyrophosphatase
MKLNLEKEAKISKGYFSDSGIDLYPIDKGEIPPKGFAFVKTGISINEWPEPAYLNQYTLSVIEGQVRGRSGNAANGIIVHNGTIDSGYTGDISVIVFNFSNKKFKYSNKKAIAQLVFNPIIVPLVKETKIKSDSREDNGFGSTDKEVENADTESK